MLRCSKSWRRSWRSPSASFWGGERQPEPEPDQNALAQQMARISEQLAVRNRREKRIWTVVAIVVGLGILIPILFMAISASGLFYRPMSGSSANYVIGMPTQDPVFSQDEVRSAMDSISTVFQKEKTWKGCTLVRMTYEESQCVAAAEKLAEEYGQGQVLAIYVTFTTGEKRVPEGLEPNKTYWDQPWFLIRSGSGWQVVR